MRGSSMQAPHSVWMLAVFIAVVALVAGFGARFVPGEWYERLEKPSWTPPSAVFPPVWAVLYIAVAVAGWEIFAAPQAIAPKLLWVVQLVLNGLWSWLFFGLRAIRAALADIVALLAAIAALLALTSTTVPLAAYLLAPYFVWVAYAAALNASIAARNR